MKRLFRFITSLILAASVLTLSACGSPMQAPESTPDIVIHTEPPSSTDVPVEIKDLPDDFAFLFEYGTNSFISYNSYTYEYATDYTDDFGKANIKLIKLSDYEMKTVYNVIFGKSDIFTFPDDLTPYYGKDSDTYLTAVNTFYTLKVRANGITKTIRLCDSYDSIRVSDEYSKEAEDFLLISQTLQIYLNLFMSENSDE